MASLRETVEGLTAEGFFVRTPRGPEDLQKAVDAAMRTMEDHFTGHVGERGEERTLELSTPYEDTRTLALWWECTERQRITLRHRVDG